MGRVAVIALLATLGVTADARAGHEKRLAARGHRHGAGCGFEDWDIKTAADPDAQLIDPVPRKTTISALTSVVRPRRHGGARIRGVETTTWKLTNVHLLEVRTEIDHDYHLVVGEGMLTMIVEIPLPECLPATSLVRDAVTRARHIAEKNLSRGGGFSNITVAGVGYFDHEHKQLGEAWNQIELHPVTAICFGRDCTLDAAEDAQAIAQAEQKVPDQASERERREAIARDTRGICDTHALAARAVQDYRSFLSSCRELGSLASRDCAERSHGKLASDVQAAVTNANNRENEFLRAWGAEAFLGINCD
jgi:hypothetical protein